VKVKSEIISRAEDVRLLLLDSDGVLTDGRITYLSDGHESLSFDVKDGFGISLAQRAGLRVAIISGRGSRVLEQRAQELGITDLYLNAHRKTEAYLKLLDKHQLQDAEVAFIGDDFIDIPVLRRVGLAVSVPEAPLEVQQTAHYVTEKGGGRGAIREVVELILKAKKSWEQATDRYF